MRRPLVGFAVAIAVIGIFTGGLAWLLDTPRPPPGAPRGQRIYYGLCVSCHGETGRGSPRAALFLLRPGNLADLDRRSTDPDQYLFDLIKNGGAPIGRPGMPAFGSALTDEEIRDVVQYVRSLSAPSRSRSG